ncbi:MAG TPA: hypothetical protein PKL81_08475 [Ferruginibacter sp.]|nr:hypothetical protein [Ferruginibacter sp.]MBN8701252.1 hypothetical protein [Chitinophagales bacterium]TXH26750.1 MAG: hypothetical protein E6Q96_07450 [Cyclobacteriaceae bacterium]HNA01519.1 hypothetical protein [Ferruginibacter sp.]HNJ94256.1 hypothetical protein [Ferruginibacter sp.]
MLKLILILLFGFPGLRTLAQSPDCAKFREGKFRIADTQAGVVTIAERKGMYQTESSEALKAVVRFRVTWQDNCSFTLRLDKVIRNENKIDFPANLEIRVKIIETKDNGYIQEVSSTLAPNTYRVEATRVN